MADYHAIPARPTDYEKLMAERDAMRYRFLRDKTGDDLDHPYVCGVHGAPMGGDGWLVGELLDAAIDAAISAQQAEGEDRG